MFIIEMSMYESDFILKNTKRSGAYDIRTFDVNHQLSLFAYYYDDYIHLKLKKYGDTKTTLSDWKMIQKASMLYPNLDITRTEDIYIDNENNQIHVKLAHVYAKERYDEQ